MSEKTESQNKEANAKKHLLVTREPTAQSSRGLLSSPIDPVIHLQRAIGNQEVQRLLRCGDHQAKLRIDQREDSYEQEADRLAEQVSRRAGSPIQGQPLPVTRLLSGEGNKIQHQRTLQAEKITPQLSAVDSAVDPGPSVLESRGQPLDSAARALLQPRFGFDFGSVRIHHDPGAGRFVQSIDARACTIDRHILFAPGEYAPETTEGQRLLSHELVHVIQQTGGLASHAASARVQRAPARSRKPAVPELAAAIDEDDATIIVFNRPVSLEEAIAYLWGFRPEDPGAIRAAPGEKEEAGKYKRFFVDIRNNLGLAFHMQHGLADQYLRRMRILRSKGPGPPPLEEQATPPWIPASLKDQIVSMSKSGEFGKDLPKVYRFPGEAPWGAIVVWVGPSEFTHDQTVIEIVQYRPEESSFYEARYSEPTARRVYQSSIEWNRDFAYYVEQKKMRPSEARLKLREESARIAVMLAGAFGMALAGAGGLTRPPTPTSSLRPRMPRGVPSPEAPVPLKVPEETPPFRPPAPKGKPMPEALEKGMLSKAPPVKIKGEPTPAGPVVRKTVTEETLLGRTRFGKAWGKASLKAQEEALQKLEAAGLDAAKIRQSFQETGELVTEYAGASVQSQWRSMSAEAKAAYDAYVSMAKKALGRGPLHDLKMRNIAYEQVEIEGVIIHRFIAFDPALDNATLLIGIFAGTAAGAALGFGLDEIVGIFTRYKTAGAEEGKKE